MPVSRHVQRAADSACAVAQHVGVDHRRRDVAMAEQFLHRADVVSPLEQVRREGMAKAVTGHALVDSRCPCRIRDGPLDDGLVQVMPAFASLLVAPSPRRGKDPLPQPLVRGRRKLPRDRVRQPDLSPSARQILVVQQPGVDELFVQDPRSPSSAASWSGRASISDRGS